MRSIATALISVWVLGGVAAAENTCEIAVTGASKVTIKSDAPSEPNQGKLAASTDHWLSDEQLRAALAMMQGIDSKLTAAEKRRRIDEAMKKDPRFVVLLINCLSDEGGIILSAASTTRYADVPMKPGSYAIVSAARKPGEFNAMFHLATRGKRESFAIKDQGKLVLTRFDRKGIAGTFSFKAEQQRSKPAKKIEVTGNFSYGCIGEKCQK